MIKIFNQITEESGGVLPGPSNKLNMEDNKASDNNNSDYNCDKCERGFSTRAKLRIHSRVHNKPLGEKKHKCTICDKSFASEADLKDHERINHNQKRTGPKKRKQERKQELNNTCEDCDYKSCSNYAFKVHMEVVHQAGDSKSPPEKKKRNVSHNARENTDNNDDFKTNNIDKTTINPDVSFLTDTAKDLSTMLGNIPPETIVDENDDGGDDEQYQNQEEKEHLGYDENSDMLQLQKRLDRLKNDEDEVLVGVVNPVKETLAKLKENETAKLREKILKMKKKLEEKEATIKELESKINKCQYNCKNCEKFNDNNSENKKEEVEPTEAKTTIPDTEMEIEDSSSASNSSAQEEQNNTNEEESDQVMQVSVPEQESDDNHVCSLCDFQSNTQEDLQNHMKTIHSEDGDWVCSICSFQTNSCLRLKQHDNLAHQNHCQICDINFDKLRDLKIHRRDIHKTFKPCWKFQENKCEFDSDCIYQHVKLAENQLICYKCGKTFLNKTALMKHIKSIHGGITCHRFIKGECKFTQSTCLYSHDLKDNKKESNRNETPKEGFHLASPNQEPPDSSPLRTQIKQEIVKMIPLILESLMPQMIENLQTYAE